MRRVWGSGVRLLFVGLVASCGGGVDTPDAAGSDAGEPDAGRPPVVLTTQHGMVEGVPGDGYVEFLGIPYARPPVGERRFAPPEPAEPWRGITRSTRPPRCVQNALGLSLASSEDCLYLNVHMPSPVQEHAPVMVWIHGGAFIFGEGLQADDGTRGDRLAAEHGVVVVSMNYRLGPFGFLAHPELTEELGGASGNLGLMDQRLALAWVRDNIEAFGGDPNNVTLFGESAGGLSVCAHLAAPSSRGLFSRAISQSGLCDTPLSDLAESEAIGANYATRVGCTTPGEVVSCLRARSVDELMSDGLAGGVLDELSNSRSFWPSLDGAFLTEGFAAAAAGGRLASVPTIMGWNADEGTLFVFLAEQGEETVDMSTYLAITQALADQHGISADDVRAQYPVADFDDPGAALAAALGHATLACPSRRAAQHIQRGGGDIRAYRFAYPNAGFQIPGDRDLGAFHSAEIQFIFGHPSRIGQDVFRSAEDRALRDAMASYWTSFARGDPQAGGPVPWPSYDAEAEMLLELDTTIAAVRNPDADVCQLWDRGAP